MGDGFDGVFAALLAEYGPQGWWPASERFEILVGALLVQNTAWTNAERAVAALRQVGMLDAGRLAAVGPEPLERLLRPAGTYRVKAERLRDFSRWLVEAGGLPALDALATPALREALLARRGIGPETADAMLLYGFDRPVFMIDAYTRRIFGRVGLADARRPYQALQAAVHGAMAPDARHYGEFHALLVALAKTRCRPRPDCGSCCLLTRCAYARTL